MEFVAPFYWSANALQLGHLVCTILYGILFIIFDMPIWQKKIGIASSYFLLFEYGLVNRGYILVILILFLIIVVLRINKQNNLLYLYYYCCFCQTEVYGVFMALVY